MSKVSFAARSLSGVRVILNICKNTVKNYYFYKIHTYYSLLSFCWTVFNWHENKKRIWNLNCNLSFLMSISTYIEILNQLDFIFILTVLYCILFRKCDWYFDLKQVANTSYWSTYLFKLWRRMVNFKIQLPNNQQ